MSSWNKWLADFTNKVGENPNWLDQQLHTQLSNIASIRKCGTVIVYASAFLQKPRSPNISIAHEDGNGFMNALYNAPGDNRLTLILHTPGGDPNAVETIVEYLHAKFSYIEVIVPYMAMSGGAMMSLASNLLVLGHQSQLGPIDPQLTTGGKTHSARSIREGFEQAKNDIASDLKLAHLWAPILQDMGPSLLTQSGKELSYSKELVHKWLSTRMFSGEAGAEKIVDNISAYFNAEQTENGPVHVHGQRIGIQKLQQLGIKAEPLERDQELQTAILNAYHLTTLIFEMGPSEKLIANNRAAMWIKRERVPQSQQQLQIIGPIPQQKPIPQQSPS